MNIVFEPLFESLFVGLFSLVLYVLLSFVIKGSFVFVLFLLGVLKHALGYGLGLQSYYCQINKSRTRAILPTIFELLGEGVLFVVVGLLLHMMIRNKFVVVCLIGIILHLVFELLGIHKYFVRTHCIFRK